VAHLPEKCRIRSVKAPDLRSILHRQIRFLALVGLRGSLRRAGLPPAETRLDGRELASLSPGLRESLVRVGLAAGHARGRSAPAHGRVPAWLAVVPPNPSGSDETISRGREVGLKRTPAIKGPRIKQRGFELSSNDQSCKRSDLRIRRLHAVRSRDRILRRTRVIERERNYLHLLSQNRHIHCPKFPHHMMKENGR
jgi:hypothetical protein